MYINIFELACLILVLASTSLAADIVEEPSSVIVPVNSTATFHCVSVEDVIITWIFTTTDDFDYILPHHSGYMLGNPNITTINGINETRAELSIQGLAAYNGSEIKCIASGSDPGHGLDQSGPAFLTVYGPPNPPGNFKATPLSHLALNVSWSEVFFPYDTIPLSYQLQIFNEGGTLIREQQLDSNTTHYILRITSKKEICKIYTFKLRSLNDAGYSSEVTTSAAIPHVPGNMENLYYITTIGNDSTCVEFNFHQRTRSTCYPVTQYEVRLTPMTANVTPINHTIHNFTTNDAGLVTLPVITDLRRDVRYLVTIIPVSTVGAGHSYTIMLSTTNVQLVYVYANTNCTCTISCEFAAGSMANGCSVTIAGNATNITSEHIIQRGHNINAALSVASSKLFRSINEIYRIRAVGIIDGNRTDINYVQTQFIPNPEQSACFTSVSSSMTSSSVIVTETMIISTESSPGAASSAAGLAILATTLVLAVVISVAVAVLVISCTFFLIFNYTRRKRHKEHMKSAPSTSDITWDTSTAIGDTIDSRINGDTTDTNDYESILDENDYDSISDDSTEEPVGACISIAPSRDCDDYIEMKPATNATLV